ncbi:hypothetical protein AB6O49_33845 [Streptomyces sp. SBR177]
MFDFGIEGYRPVWQDRRRDVARAHGDRLRDVAHGNVEIGFAFEPGYVSVFNTLDENGISFEAPGPDHRS